MARASRQARLPPRALRHERQWAWVMAMASASAASALSGTARGRRRATMALIWPLSPWPAPTTVFFTAFGAYSAIEHALSSDGTSMAMPRAWPSFNVAEASRLTKVCSMAASSGESRAKHLLQARRKSDGAGCRGLAHRRTRPSRRRRKPSLAPSLSMTPQPVRRKPGSMPIMRIVPMPTPCRPRNCALAAANHLGDFAMQQGRADSSGRNARQRFGVRDLGVISGSRRFDGEAPGLHARK